MWDFRKLLYKQKLQIFFLLLWAGQKIIRWELTKIKTLDVRSISVGQYYIHQILCLDKLFQFINFSAVTFSTTSQNTLHKDIWWTMPILMFRIFHMRKEKIFQMLICICLNKKQFYFYLSSICKNQVLCRIEIAILHNIRDHSEVWPSTANIECQPILIFFLL